MALPGAVNSLLVLSEGYYIVYMGNNNNIIPNIDGLVANRGLKSLKPLVF